jgi:O-antigen ligase
MLGLPRTLLHSNLKLLFQTSIPMANIRRDMVENNSGSGGWEKLQFRVNLALGTIPRLTILVGLIVLVAAEVFLVSSNHFPYAVAVAFVPFLIIGFSLLLHHFDYSLVVLLATAAFIPLKLPTGTGSPLVASLVLAIVLVVLWVLRMMVIERRVALKPSLVNRPALGFMVVTLVSLVWGNILMDPSVSVPATFIFVQVGAASVMVISPAISLMVGNLITSERQLKLMVGIMLLVGVIGLAENFLNVNLFTVIGGLTSAWVVALAFGLALFNDQIKRRWKWLLFVLVGLWFLWNLVLNINWYAGWLPGLVAVGVIAFQHSKRLFLFFLVLLVVYVAINYAPIMQNIGFKQTNDGDTRLAAWTMNWTVTSQHLLLGTGPAGYAAYYMSLFPNQAMATHNNYIDVLSETGVIGSFFYLWLFGSFAWLGLKVVRRLRGRRDFKEALAVSAFAGLIGCIVIMAFGDWMLPFAYTQTIAGFNYTIYSWLFIGTLLALDHMTRETA